MSRELLKIVCQAVVVIRDEDGRALAEAVSQEVACYGPEQLLAFYNRAQAEVAAANSDGGDEEGSSE